jgi:hypothetical protein
MPENWAAVEEKLQFNTKVVAWGLAFIVVLAISMTFIMVWQAYRVGSQAEQLRQVATETHDSLCTLYDDVKQRHANGVKYLKENPGDFVLGNVPRETLQASVDAQADTIDALERGGLEC